MGYFLGRKGGCSYTKRGSRKGFLGYFLGRAGGGVLYKEGSLCIAYFSYSNTTKGHEHHPTTATF